MSRYRAGRLTPHAADGGDSGAKLTASASFVELPIMKVGVRPPSADAFRWAAALDSRFIWWLLAKERRWIGDKKGQETVTG